MHTIRRTFFILAMSLGVALTAHGQAPADVEQTPAPGGSTAAQTAGTLRGHIVDPTGALIPGATVTITNSAGVEVKSVSADSAGSYSVGGLAPGGYIIKATFQGFAPFSSPTIQLAAGQSKRVDISMAVEVAEQNVTVTDDSPQVNVEASGNANSIVLKGKDLDALSDDPDELSNELTALAGPSAGPNGGQIYIDGFTGGQLPPKSAIREIRINQNPFSAEFDHLGYGRIEILTKPGTDKLHGQVFLMGNDSGLNNGSPFLNNVPPYYRLQYNGTVSGSLSKTASFFFSMEQRDNHDEAVYNYFPAVQDTATGVYSIANTRSSGALSNPHNHINISPRIDFQLGQKTTITARYQFYYDSESGDIGSTQLPSQSETSSSTEHTLQLSDSVIINDHAVNETRFEYRRALNSVTPVSTLPTLVVAGDFTGGGSGGTSNDHQDHLELQNYTTLSVGTQAIKFGMWLRDNRDAQQSFAGHNGSAVFTETGYVDALNALENHQSLTTLPQGDFVNLSIAAGRTAYTANVFDGALFFQDDWKVNPRLTLSGGLRWETQNHIADHSDWNPRVAFAYALDAKGKKPAKTVLRAGFGLFHDRIQTGDVLAATRQGVDAGQLQITNDSPACLSGTDLNDLDFSACIPAAPYTPNAQSTIVEIAPGAKAPVTQQIGASIERQVTKAMTFTTTYLNSFGTHQMVTRDANAYLPGTFQYGSSTLTGARPNPSLGIVSEYYPEAVFKENQLILNINDRISPKVSIFGFYNLSFANSNSAGGTASDSYNLNKDYGPAGFVHRNMLFLMGNYTGPWGIRFNPFLIAHSGGPYNIVSSLDLSGDTFLNNRPGVAASSMCTAGSQQYFETQFGCLDSQPSGSESILPINAGKGPAAVALNLRISRSFGLGPKVEGMNGAGGPPGGGPPGGGRGGGRGGPGGGLGPGGLGGGGGPGGMMGPQGPNRKYNLNFSAQALNLFNDVNYSNPVGTLGSKEFGYSTTLANGPFSGPGGSTSRRIFLQAVFSF